MKLILLLLLLVNVSLADTPPPGQVKSNTYSGDGATAITATGTSLNVNVTNSSGASTVNQGNAGSQSWLVDVTNTVPVTGTFWQTTQPVSQSGNFSVLQSGTWSTGRTWTLSNTTDSVDIGNFPSTQAVTGTFWQATQPVSLSSLPSLAVGSNTIGNVNINGTVPISGTISTTNSANANPGGAIPTQATMVGGSDGTDLRSLKVSSAGVLSVDGSATTQPVSGTFWQTTQPVSGTFFQATQPVSASSLPLPTGAATSALQTTGNTSLSSIASSTGNIPAQGQALSAASMPVVLPSAQITALTPPTSISVSNFPATQPVSAASLPLPTGASTAAKQPALGTAGTASSDVITVQGISSMTALKVDGSGVTQPVSASSLPLPTGAATASNQGTANTTLSTIASNTTNAGTPVVSGTVTANAGSGTFTVSASSLPLPTGAATSANQSTIIANQTNGTQVIALPTGASTSALQTTGNTSLSSIATNTANIPAQGLANVTGATPISFSKATTLTTTAFTSVTGTINTDMLTGSASGWFDATGYTSFSADIYTTTTVTGGVITFEQTNDTTNDAAGITMSIQDSTAPTAQTVVTTLSLAASTIKHYQAPIISRYIRFRLSTAFAGTGTVAATVNFRQTPYNPISYGVQNTTGGNLIVNLGSVSLPFDPIPGLTADVASAAIATTTTTATLTPTGGSSYQVDIPVTAATGTNPTMVVQVQESMDTGTNWNTVYTFPTITTTGSYLSPVLPLQGNRVRYVQTIGGSTPSFTRAINRLQSGQKTFKAPGGTNFTDRSGSTSGSVNTSTLVAAANPLRKYFIIQNLSTTTAIYINFTSAANTTSSLYIAPLGSYVMESDTITTEAINVLSTGTSIVYSAKEG